MNRAELQRLARARLDDARSLFSSGRFGGAYYMAGYAVEMGLKSCVLRHLDDMGAIFKDKKYLRNLADCWTHDLGQLLDLAGMKAELDAACKVNPLLGVSWGVVKDWKEISRYKESTDAEARDLINAIDDDPNGVFRWLQTRW